MIICPSCSASNGDKEPRCSKCGASLLGINESQNKENIRIWRGKQRTRGHILTGVILCFGLPTLFGFPSSLMPMEILRNLFFAILFGAPLGYCVSRFADSVIGGAAIGCGIGIVYCIVTMALSGGPVTIGAILMGIGTGLLPGAIMGLHVSMDR